MYDATTKFINRLRWKVFFHNSDNNDQYKHKKEDIYKIFRSAPASNELKAFNAGFPKWAKWPPRGP